MRCSNRLIDCRDAERGVRERWLYRFPDATFLLLCYGSLLPASLCFARLAFDCLFLFLSVFLFYFAFNDSIVYYTDIQELDSVELDKNGFLPKRDLYTYQLKNYLEYNLKKPDYTCMIYFAENKKKLEKEAVKVKGKYKKSKNMVLQVVKPEAFTFTKPQE